MRLLTITQAARDLRVPVTTLRDRLRRYGVNGLRLGNYRLINEDDARRVMHPIRGIAEVTNDYTN